MSETDINATVNVTEDIYADVDSTAMSAAVIDDGDSIVVPAEVDFGHTLDTELEDNDLIDVPVDESVGIAGDHRVLLHRDAPNQHPISAITGLNDALAGIDTALSSRISQVEAETADLDVDMAGALLRIGELQNQVDGNITTWFYAAEPAMNLPPVAYDPSNPHDTGWDTDDKKNEHKGDLYYNTLTGYAYRFAYSDGEYGWLRITDTDVVKALADAAKAQDTADSKRRVFYTTPYPPYDKGDLWVQGSTGDILVCSTDKPAGGTYDFADWAKASKYTDDTVADIALASANGKNTVYHQASQPTGGTYKQGDTWFDTDDDYTMYTYNGSLWVKEQFGNEAIKDLSITNAKIANATIEYGKIKSVDAGKITVGYLNADRIQSGSIGVGKIDAESGTFNTANIPNLNANKITAGDISADRMKVNSISAINSNTGTVKISADKVNIEGAAIFTGSGRLSQTSLDSSYDANGAATGAVSGLKTDLASESGTTVINGGHIATGTLDADRISAQSISIGLLNDDLKASLMSDGIAITTEYSGTNIVYSVVLKNGGVDVTSNYPSGDYEWWRQMPDGREYLGQGYTKTMAMDDVSYGQTVYCTWTRRQQMNLLTNTGNKLRISTGAYLLGRSEY